MASKWLLLIVLLALTGCWDGTSSEGSQATSSTDATTPEPSTTLSTSTTFAPISTSQATTSTAAAAPTPTIVLQSDGLGVVSFGEPVEDVMAVLTELLGPPDWEQVQIAADTDLSVRWGDDGEEALYLQFTYWDYFDSAPEPPQPMPEGPVFHYYLTKTDELGTDAGITVGSTVGDLQSAYPDVRFTSFCADEVREFVIDPPRQWLHLPMWGLLDGDPANEFTRIEYIGAGWDRTPCSQPHYHHRPC